MKNTENKDKQTEDVITFSREEVEEVKNDLTCSITGSIFAVPVILPCCENVVEKAALVQCVSQKTECPFCRKTLLPQDISSLSINKAIQREVSRWMKKGVISLNEWYFDFNGFISYTRDTSAVKTLLLMVKDEKFQNTLTRILSDETDPQKIDEAKVYFLSMLLKEETELTKEISKQFDAIIKGNEEVRDIQEKIDKEYPIAQLMVLPGSKGIDLLKRFSFILNNAKPEELGKIILDLLCEEKPLEADPSLLPLLLQKLMVNESALKMELNKVEKEGPLKGMSVVLGFLTTLAGQNYLRKNPKILTQLLRHLNKDTLNAISEKFGGCSILHQFLILPEDIVYSAENIELLPSLLTQVTDDTLNLVMPSGYSITLGLIGTKIGQDLLQKKPDVLTSLQERLTPKTLETVSTKDDQEKSSISLLKFPVDVQNVAPEILGKVIFYLLFAGKQLEADPRMLPLLLQKLMVNESLLKTELNRVEKEGPLKGISVVMGLIFTSMGLSYLRKNPKILTQFLRHLNKDTLNSTSKALGEGKYSIVHQWLGLPGEIVNSKENIELLPFLLSQITDDTLNLVSSKGYSIIIGVIGMKIWLPYLIQEKPDVFASLLTRLTSKTLNTLLIDADGNKPPILMLLANDYSYAFFKERPALLASLLEKLTKETCTALITTDNASIVSKLISISRDLSSVLIAENPGLFVRMLKWANEAKIPLHEVYIYAIACKMLGSDEGRSTLIAHPDFLVELLKRLTPTFLEMEFTDSYHKEKTTLAALVKEFQEKQVQKKPLLAESMEKSIFTKPEENLPSQTSSTNILPGLGQKKEGE